MSSYLYENATPDQFQEFVQALLLPEYPRLQCFPVAQPDGGRDALTLDPVTRDTTVVQIKFKRRDDPDGDTATWMIEALERELPKIDKLAARGATSYVMATNARGSAHLDRGSVDKVQTWMENHLSIPAQCLWRDDLDRRFDRQHGLKLTYPMYLTGANSVELVLDALLSQVRARQKRTLKAFLAHQYMRDAKVKFKQVDLKNDLMSLFIDVPVAPSTKQRSGNADPHQADALIHYVFAAARSKSSAGDFEDYTVSESTEDADWQYRYLSKVGAASLLLSPPLAANFPNIVLEGGPGQGKSTLSQYLCQVHRARLLNKREFLDELPESHCETPVRLPIKVDLRDLATWLLRKDPFAPDHPAVPELSWTGSLESFLAWQINRNSGGGNFSPDDLRETFSRMSALLFFDGLDEVADIEARRNLIVCITDGLGRIRANAHNVQVVVTSRPSAFENSPGFDHREFRYLELQNVSGRLITGYAEKWIKARELDEGDALDVRRILSEKLSLPHIRDLARNPMQLAILLTLVHSIGYSLPDQRTDLYASYMDRFLTREAEKSPAVRKHRDLLVRIHQYLAWMLQTEAEDNDGSSGSLSFDRLRAVMSEYLQTHDHPGDVLNELFTGALERVVVLVQRVEGTYEFEVQPIREFFCARYLYETAAVQLRPGEMSKGTRPERFDAISRSPYWTNVTRFYAGCYTSGEIASLYMQLEEYKEDNGNAVIFRPRELGALLLGDWAFKNYPRAVKRVVDCVFDVLGVRGAARGFSDGRAGRAVSLPLECGRSELQRILIARLEMSLEEPYTGEVITLLAANMSQAVVDWAAKRIESFTGQRRTRWIEVALRLGVFDRVPVARLIELVAADVDHADEAALLERTRPLFRLRPRLVCEVPPLAPIAVRLALAGHGQADWHEGSWFGRFIGLCSAGHAVARLEQGWRLGNDHAAISFTEYSDPPADRTSETTFLMETQDLPDGVISLGGAWGTSLSSWSVLLNSMHRNFGKTWAAYRIGNIAAGIRAADEKGSGAKDLFNDETGLALRARYARLRSGQPAWWKKQYTFAVDDLDKMFWCLLLLTWGSPITIVHLQALLEETVDNLPQSRFELLYSSFRGDHTVNERGAAKLVLASLPTSRIVGLLAQRFDMSTLGPDLEALLQREPANGPYVAERNATRELGRMGNSVTAEVLTVVRGLYVDPETRFYADRWAYRRPLVLDLESADVILALPEQYPYGLLAAAESRKRTAIAVDKVRDYASRSGWTFE